MSVGRQSISLPRCRLGAKLAGLAALTISNSGRLDVGDPNNDADLYVSHSGSGTMDMSASAVADVSRTLFVGYNATGVLNVADSSVNAGEQIVLGANATGDGTLNVSGGSSVDIATSMFVGEAGAGSIPIADGSVSTGSSIAMAIDPGSAGDNHCQW